MGRSRIKYNLLSATVMANILLGGCYYDKADKLYPNAASCDTAQITYSSHVRPIIAANCLNMGCHTSGNPSGGFNFETHQGLSSVLPNGRLSNAINYKAGGSKNMPPSGKMDDCTIKKVDAWIARGAPNN